MKLAILIAGLVTVAWCSDGYPAGFERKKLDADLDTLPKTRTFHLTPARQAMTEEEMEIDHRIHLGQLRLPDGRKVMRGYALDIKNKIIIGSPAAAQVSITEVSGTKKGRAVRVMFLNAKGEVFRPKGADVGVWSVELEPLDYGYPKIHAKDKPLHVDLDIDRSMSMAPYLAKVKAAASQFLRDVGKQGKCSVLAFNRLVMTYQGAPLSYVNYDGNVFDGRVHDVAPEGQGTDFAALYPEALLEKPATSQEGQLHQLITAGQWGEDCVKGITHVQKIEAMGGTSLLFPLLLNLRAGAVAMTGGKSYHHIIAMVTDGSNQDGSEAHRKEILALKKTTGAKVFVYWIGKNPDRAALNGIVDYSIRDDGQSRDTLKNYLDSINVFITKQQIITLPNFK